MIEFTKMQGLGNDYVYIDAVNQKIENASLLSKIISDRHFGVGSDGLILICKSERADFKMQMFNSDGSEAEMCGNGIRCVGKFVYDKRLTDKTILKIETLAGVKKLQLNITKGKVDTVRVDMGLPIFEAKKIPVISNKEIVKNLEIEIYDKKFKFTCLSMGNPHAVAFIENVENLEVEKYGSKIEINEKFPKKTNVEFIEIVNKKHIKMRVWERGAGETLACGTGACASVVAGVTNNLLEEKVTVELLGGRLEIEWNKENKHVYMTGPAVTVFEGRL